MRGERRLAPGAAYREALGGGGERKAVAHVILLGKTMKVLFFRIKSKDEVFS